MEQATQTTDIVSDGVRIPLRPESGLSVATRRQLCVKRSIDVLISSALLVLLAPLMLVLATVVWLTSTGPALYAQDRVGKDGEHFRLRKFRSMAPGADRRKVELQHDNHVHGPAFKMARDPRVTPVGRILRRLSLDELPQLLNVLGGSMTLVGPRPPLPDEVARYTDHQYQRLLVRPGLTCIWQVSGRSDILFDQWVEMDLEYIRSWSLGLDLRLLVRTLPAVLGGRGAY